MAKITDATFNKYIQELEKLIDTIASLGKSLNLVDAGKAEKALEEYDRIRDKLSKSLLTREQTKEFNEVKDRYRYECQGARTHISKILQSHHEVTDKLSLLNLIINRQLPSAENLSESRELLIRFKEIKDALERLLVNNNKGVFQTYITQLRTLANKAQQVQQKLDNVEQQLRQNALEIAEKQQATVTSLPVRDLVKSLLPIEVQRAIETVSSEQLLTQLSKASDELAVMPATQQIAVIRAIIRGEELPEDVSMTPERLEQLSLTLARYLVNSSVDLNLQIRQQALYAIEQIASVLRKNEQDPNQTLLIGYVVPNSGARILQVPMPNLLAHPLDTAAHIATALATTGAVKSTNYMVVVANARQMTAIDRASRLALSGQELMTLMGRVTQIDSTDELNTLMDRIATSHQQLSLEYEPIVLTPVVADVTTSAPTTTPLVALAIALGTVREVLGPEPLTLNQFSNLQPISSVEEIDNTPVIGMKKGEADTRPHDQPTPHNRPRVTFSLPVTQPSVNSSILKSFNKKVLGDLKRLSIELSKQYGIDSSIVNQCSTLLKALKDAASRYSATANLASFKTECLAAISLEKTKKVFNTHRDNSFYKMLGDLRDWIINLFSSPTTQEENYKSNRASFFHVSTEDRLTRSAQQLYKLHSDVSTLLEERDVNQEENRPLQL